VTDSLSPVEGRTTSRPLGLALLLAGMASLAVLLVAADSRGWLNVLGWRKTPGPILLVGLLALVIALLRLRQPISWIVAVAASFGTSLFLSQIADAVQVVADIFPFPTPLWLLAALAPPLLGGCLAYRMRVPVILQVGFVLLGGYIQAVHIYNAFNLGQHMGFFGGGWTG
jgi:hypothetical protein